MNTRIFETTRDFHGTTKTLSPVQAIAELEPADATALLTTISKLCNYDATQHANLMWLMGLLTSIAVCLEATEQEDLLDIHKALCGDSYEFLMAAFNPDHLESTLIDIESCSPDILDGISEILATMH